MCHSEKTHLWGCRDPWGQQRRGILLGQEERERTFSCQGKKGRGGRQRTMGRRHRLYGKSTLHSPCSSKAGMRWCQTRSFWRCSVPFSPNALIFEIVLNLLFLRLWDWVASSNPKEGNWESGRSQTAGHGPGRAALGFLAGRVGKSGLGPESGHAGDRSGRYGDGSSGAAAGCTRLSVLGPVGGGGGHEADAGTAAAAAAAAAAEAALGGQRARDAGGAGLAHQHGAPSAARAHPGPAHAGAAEAAGPDAAAAGESDAAAGEAGAGDQGIRPAHHAAPGAAYGCGREKPSSERLSHRLGGGRRGGPVASGGVTWVQVVPTLYTVNTHFSLPLSGDSKTGTPLKSNIQTKGGRIQPIPQVIGVELAADCQLYGAELGLGYVGKK